MPGVIAPPKPIKPVVPGVVGPIKPIGPVKPIGPGKPAFPIGPGNLKPVVPPKTPPKVPPVLIPNPGNLPPLGPPDDLAPNVPDGDPEPPVDGPDELAPNVPDDDPEPPVDGPDELAPNVPDEDGGEGPGEEDGEEEPEDEDDGDEPGDGEDDGPGIDIIIPIPLPGCPPGIICPPVVDIVPVPGCLDCVVDDCTACDPECACCCCPHCHDGAPCAGCEVEDDVDRFDVVVGTDLPLAIAGLPEEAGRAVLIIAGTMKLELSLLDWNAEGTTVRIADMALLEPVPADLLLADAEGNVLGSLALRLLPADAE